MPNTCSTSRGSVRLRALAAAGVVIAAVACNAGDTAGPVTEDTPAETAPALASPSTPAPQMASASLSAPGVPFGDFHLPTSLFSSSMYTGSLQALSPSSAMSVLNAALKAGNRVVISMAGNRRNYTNSNGTFNMTLWKSRVAAFKSLNFGQFVTSGTVIGHYLVDEPLCSQCWGGTQITFSQIEEMSKYSKSIWPSMPTGVRAAATQAWLHEVRLARLCLGAVGRAAASAELPAHPPAVPGHPGRRRAEARPRPGVRTQLSERRRRHEPCQRHVCPGSEPLRQRLLQVGRKLLPLCDVGQRGQERRLGARGGVLRLRPHQLGVRYQVHRPQRDEGRIDCRVERVEEPVADELREVRQAGQHAARRGGTLGYLPFIAPRPAWS